jgi:hypothetical protein
MVQICGCCGKDVKVMVCGGTVGGTGWWARNEEFGRGYLEVEVWVAQMWIMWGID